MSYMKQHEHNTEINNLEACLTVAIRRLMNYTRKLNGEGAETEAFQCYQLVENIATLADAEIE